ncbi:hypothetical protein P8C59_009605 [Phyllachora maydis]|uniref:Uncharacterized protein n=1 Tax=Phyllachora maydis TaxID=1825666 RepID=A0AAD9MFT1_9PEZI|nr:hypothetical protein P8C59_009605 [Phyllachora maydis]
MADQAKGKGIAPKRASNPADLGQSSRPLPPIRTLLEDKEDSKDYSEVIEVLKQYIKSYERVIASQSSNIKIQLLSLNTLKASVEDSVSAIKNISSTLASLTNSSNAAATGKTSYSPRFDPFSSTMDLDSPPRPPRKEPYLGPAVNSATSNLDPPLDTGSKEGFKDTITSSIVKELSKKAYTIPDDTVLLMLLRNSLSSGPRAAILWIHIPSKAFKLLVRQYSRPIESKKEDVYNKFHALTFNTYKKGLSAFNAEFNGYLAKLTVAKIDIDPSLILNQYFKALESKFPSWLLALKGYKKRKDFKGKGLKTSSNNKAKYKDNKPRRRPRDSAFYNSWLYNTGSTDYISNSKERFTTFTPNTGQLRPINTGNGPISPAGIGSITLEVLSRKAPPTYTKLVLNNVLYLPNIDINIVSRVRHYNSGGCLIKETLYRGDRRCIAVLDFKKSGFFLNVKRSSKPILHTNFAFPLGLSSYTTKSIEPQRNKIVVEIPSNSIRKEDYRPIIEDAIVSEAIEPNKRYKLRNSLAKGTTLEGIGPSLRGKRPRRPVEPLATAQAPYQSPRKTREPKPLTGTRDLPYVLREPVIEGNKVEKAISSPTLKEPNIGQRDYYNLLNLAKLWHVRLGHIGLRLLKKTSSITKGLPNFDKIKEADFHCSSCDRGKAVRRVSKALIPDPPRVLDSIEEDTVKIRPRPYNRNPIVLLLVDRKKRYRAIGAKGEAIIPLEKRSKSLKFTSRTEEYKLLAVLGSKTYLVYIPSRRAVLKTSTVKFIEDNTVLSQPTNNTALEGELVDLDLDLEGAVSPDPSNLNTEKPISIEIGPSKLEPYESSSDKAFPQTIEPIFAPKPIEVIAPNQPITNEPLDNSDLISEGDKMQLDYYKLLAKTSSYILSFVYKARKRVISKDSTPTTYKQVLKLPRDKRRAFLNSALREEIYIEIPQGLLDLAASNKAIYKLLLKYGYNPSTPNIIKLSKALYGLKQSPREWQDKLNILLKSLGYLPLISDPGVFYNAKTCYFIVPYIDDCLFIGPDIGYITDLKKQLNKLQYVEEAVSRFNLADSKPISIPLQPGLWLSRSLNRPTKSHSNAAKNLFKYLNSTKDYSICFSYNGNTVADLGPKLSNSSNITTKLSRDFHSKEGPRPLTTTSTTIVDSRNSKGSSRTSIINSSLVLIGFSDSDFAEDKATSKSTYGYLYKLAGGPISWKTKRATTIALSTLEAETDGLTEAIREVQWIIGLFSELHRPIDHPFTLYRDNQGSITVANDPALYARTKHTLLKFRYVREQVKAKIVTIIYLNTKCMPADGLTKALPGYRAKKPLPTLGHPAAATTTKLTTPA